MLTQQLITGIQSSKIRECLLSEDASKLSWDRACELARTKNDVDKQCSIFPSVYNTVANVRKTFNVEQRITCYRCGAHDNKANHVKCPAIRMKYRISELTGHFARICMSKPVQFVSFGELDSIEGQGVSQVHDVYLIDSCIQSEPVTRNAMKELLFSCQSID